MLSGYPVELPFFIRPKFPLIPTSKERIIWIEGDLKVYSFDDLVNFLPYIL